MEYRYMVHPTKALVAAATAIVLLAGGVDLLLGMKWYAVIFLSLGGIFCVIAGIYGKIVTITAQGVRSSLAVFQRKTFSWDQIGEIGVVGTRVFNNANPTPGKRGEESIRTALYSKTPRIGTPYIYFSPESLTEEQRFRLALEWPPQGMVFLRYSPERMEIVRQLSLREIEKYNTGDLLI